MARFALSAEAVQNILQAPDYRSFIVQFIQERAKTSRFGFADIAREGGFASRSFPHDVVKGKKRLTLKSIAKMTKGLGLRVDLAGYFRILVEIEHPDCRQEVFDEVQLVAKLRVLRERITQKGPHVGKYTDAPFEVYIVPQIYSALGTESQGATLSHIFRRTELAEDRAIPVLTKLISLGFVEKRGSRYHALQNHVSIPGLKDSEFFKKYFIHSAESAIQKAKKSMNSEEKLFLSSAFSVRAEDLPKMKVELREVLLRYIDNSEQANGDKVVNLVASLF